METRAWLHDLCSKPTRREKAELIHTSTMCCVRQDRGHLDDTHPERLKNAQRLRAVGLAQQRVATVRAAGTPSHMKQLAA